MKTSVEALSEVEIKVEVEIPAETVDREYARQLSRFGQRSKVKGFRPGKAPKALVRKQFGTSIAAETARALISNSLGEVLDGLEQTPLGEPAIEPGLAQEGEAMTYAVRVQVKPSIEIHSWEDIEVTVPAATVDDAKVAERLSELQARHKERVPVEDRGADTGDILIVGLEGFLEGTPDPRLGGDHVEINVGAGRMIPGFEDQLIGAKAGQVVEVEATFPDDYGPADLSGKDARWNVTIHEVYVEETPEADDDFAQDVGFDTLDLLLADLRTKLEGELEATRKGELERRVVTVLLERNAFKIPPVLHQAAMEDRARNMLQLLRMQGADQEMAIEIINSNLEGLSRTAETSVRRQLALEAFAKAQGIEADDEALSEEIARLINEQGERTAKLYEKEEMRETLRMEMTQRRALERILESAHVIDEKPAAPEAAAPDVEEDA
ncbi:MAG: trigger factor [Deltaproteobacteria bacterium HGW-Deltaproteobacteria-14]|jgi:trigger factor|nr:MAG: trigger factor [Deltaproteobacteria bacterium HGW-Deltaproteobacteria-14]